MRGCPEAGYHEELSRLDAASLNFRYVPTVSRPELCPDRREHAGRVNTVFRDGRVSAGPARDDVFLCGSPEMVRDMQSYFESKGYARDRVRGPGSLHVER